MSQATSVISELRAELDARQAPPKSKAAGLRLPSDMAAQLEQLQDALACDRTTVIKMLIRRGLKTFDQAAPDDTPAESGKPNTIRVKLAPAIAKAVSRARANSGQSVDDIVNAAIAQAFEVEVA